MREIIGKYVQTAEELLEMPCKEKERKKGCNGAVAKLPGTGMRGWTGVRRAPPQNEGPVLPSSDLSQCKGAGVFRRFACKWLYVLGV